MQIRTSKIRKNGKTYQYTQLVESYRRQSDGMPMHRVIANLSNMPPIEIAGIYSQPMFVSSQHSQLPNTALTATLFPINR